MIGLGFYNSTPTSLDLNGPFLRFTSEPESETVNDGGSVTLSGIATAEFKHNPTTIPGEFVTNTGSISYQWYIDCLLYTSPSPRDPKTSRMPSSA